jgi:hypothetical protein
LRPKPGWASGYDGYYHFPNVEKAFVVTTNFRHSALIKSKHRNYTMTSKHPESFIEPIEKTTGIQKAFRTSTLLVS